ncbi:hypothetical protein A4X13_0g1730 [Tilletia indica]|uniref:Uncharacterized protein n=1 Tax=Tilletia indica TaxID=43049 RepID=A0A8T8TBT9_9BASI|nr:hypothetical protein A4X13_0g1730 [Tilletia indica]
MQSLSVTCPDLSRSTAERWTSTIPVSRRLRIWNFGYDDRDRGAQINLVGSVFKLVDLQKAQGSGQDEMSPSKFEAIYGCVLWAGTSDEGGSE